MNDVINFNGTFKYSLTRLESLKRGGKTKYILILWRNDKLIFYKEKGEFIRHRGHNDITPETSTYNFDDKIWLAVHEKIVEEDLSYSFKIDAGFYVDEASLEDEFLNNVWRYFVEKYPELEI